MQPILVEQGVHSFCVGASVSSLFYGGEGTEEIAWFDPGFHLGLHLDFGWRLTGQGRVCFSRNSRGEDGRVVRGLRHDAI